ncbi:hypothetical protein Nepgr_014194 [Nepenthes gracilis]|uniref:WRKY domain-containing protein n=1 Tax=Nepenthes gracilis TaxID=150966 RepID=A0AAD3SJJ5_NEPGR|nr:hypothetical protein Nepgr_014194 [Nepenthes gracilis]
MGSSPADSHRTPFTTCSSLMTTTSFTDLLNSAGDEALFGNRVSGSRGVADRNANRKRSGVPKFKSFPPPSLPISPPAVSPSYFAIPPGLSPTELLDSPVLLSSSNIMPSPTTGTFAAAQAFNWKINAGAYQQGIKQEDRTYSGFTLQTQTSLDDSPSTLFQSSFPTVPTVQVLKGEQHQQQQKRQPWGFQEQNTHIVPSSGKNMQIEDSNQGNIKYQTEESNYPNHQPSQCAREQRRSEDGYNWRKYGQKVVKGSENPRSYYKCTYPNCPTKKKVEKSLDGQITEIVYKGSHNHPKPQNSRRSSASAASTSSQPMQFLPPITEVQDPSFAGQMESVATPDNSSISVVDGDHDRSSDQNSGSTGHEFDEDEPDAKRWKDESENESISAAPGSRTVREPRVVVQTPSDIDILDDGYRWRKYGQKVVKGNPNPRSYYKCTCPGCPVRKHIERASHDLRSVITTYEGKHNHDVPATRGSGSHIAARPPPQTGNSSTVEAMAIKPSVNYANNAANSHTLHKPPLSMPASMERQSHSMVEMLPSPGTTGFWDLEIQMNHT